jgi:hypothetical protein
MTTGKAFYPSVDPAGRSVLYVGGGLATSACEVFGEAGEALICLSWRVALLEPVACQRLLDLAGSGQGHGFGGDDAPARRAHGEIVLTPGRGVKAAMNVPTMR